jgi:hypothetical protein
MSLTRAQKEFIAAGISHFLDFPSDRELLCQEIIKLQKAFANPADKKNEYYQLRRCLTKPTKTLLRLETHNENEIMVGTVQIYLVDLITNNLEQSAVKAHISLAETGWDGEKIKQTLIAPANFQLVFKSTAARVDNSEFSWHQITDAGKVFTAALVPREDISSIALEVEVELPDGIHTEIIDNFCGTPAGEYDQGLYLRRLIPAAKKTAYDIACKTVLDFLHKHNVAKMFYPAETENHSGIEKIVTDQFYLDMIIERKINLHSLTLLAPEQRNNLLERVVKSLITNHYRTFTQAKYLSKTEILIAGCYFTLLQQKKISYEDIASITEENSKIMLLPIIINLITKNKLKFNTAKHLSPALRPLLCSDLYMDYFLNEDINWEKMTLLTKEDCDYFLDPQSAPGIASLIKNKIIVMTDIFLSAKRTLDRLQMESIQELLLKSVISLESAKSLSVKAVNLINSHVQVRQWIIYEMINAHELDLMDFAELCADVYARRLFALQLDSPFRINGHTDSLEIISAELPAIAVAATMDITTLRENIIRRYIIAIDEQIKILLPSAASKEEQDSLLALQKEFDSKAEILEITTMLHDLMMEYDSLLATLNTHNQTPAPSHQHTLFNQNNYRSNMRTFSNLIESIRLNRPPSFR